MTAVPAQDTLATLAQAARAWPFEEARRLHARLATLKDGAHKTVIFSTGYGPSGLPHIGTFGEVARTSMVRHAFASMYPERKTRLICFSDDLDGLRKVPDNVPDKARLLPYLNMPLTKVPDPFSDAYPSFAHHNNARLKRFLDRFGFDYEFFSATETYASGELDATLLKMLTAYDAVMDIILPTLGPERRATYAPFLPISPTSGRVLQVPMLARDVAAGTITYQDPDSGQAVTTKVTGGAVKCQWKADWALRWTALGVDYEMAGKDLIDSVKLSSQICKALGGTPPEGFTYEHFLDEKGAKISKSIGNGLTIDEWLRYGTAQSLALFMYQKPKSAKRLYFDVIPRAVDEYLTFLAKFPAEAPAAQLENPVWLIHGGHPPKVELPISFQLLLNIASVSNAENKDVLWGFIRQYAPDATPATMPALDELAQCAIAYFHDRVKPQKRFRAASELERTALTELSNELEKVAPGTRGDALQDIVYAVGKAHAFEPLRAWFQGIYEVLLGESQGPRFGSFIELYGIPETRALIARALAGDLITKP